MFSPYKVKMNKPRTIELLKKKNLIESFIFASIQMPFVLTYGLLFMFWGIRWQGQKSNFSYHFEVIIPLPKKKKKIEVII